MTESSPESRRTRIRVLVLGMALPIGIALATTALLASWLPELPDPIAVHWSGAGPDGFGPAVPFILLPLGITVLFSAFAAVVAWRTTPSGRLTWNQKFLIVTSLWLAVLLNLGIGWSVAMQRGLDDAGDAPDAGLPLAVAAGIGLLLATALWFLLPPAETVDKEGTAPRALDVQGEERVSWTRTARLGAGALAVILLVFAFVIVVTVVALVASRGSVWFPVILLVVVAVLIATNTWWRVVADRRGFLVRGAFGWPRRLIPLADIRSVLVVEVRPSRDFGGWGWRWGGNGRCGVILRAGEGIEVTQSSGKRFVVTVDDAATGAAALAALLRQNAR